MHASIEKMYYTREEAREKFYLLKTRQDVADMLGATKKQLNYVLYVKHPDQFYQHFFVHKRSGGVRSINAPEKPVKDWQKKIAEILLHIYEPRKCVHGFVHEKNILTNAECHIRKKVILNIDLKDFFEQINFGRVRGMFMAKPYELGTEAATTLAQILCLNGKLPQGSPASPIVANMICVSLDHALMRLCKEYKLQYTRYADDITISTYKSHFPAAIVYFNKENQVQPGEALLEVLSKNGFAVNDKKIFLNYFNSRQEVTGVIVNEFANVKRRYLKNIRSILYKCKKDGLYSTALDYIDRKLCKNAEIEALRFKEQIEENERFIIENWFQNVLKGKILFLKQIRGKDNGYFIKYAKELNEICGKEIISFEDVKTLEEKIAEGVLVITREDELRQGSCFLLQDIGLVTSYHVMPDDEYYYIHSFDEEYKTRNMITSRDMHAEYFDREIDYIILKIGKLNTNYHWPLGKREDIKIGSNVIIIGYPNWIMDSQPYREECTIVSARTYMGATLYVVNGKIIHGASGGVVLNSQYEVVGVIKAGAQTFDDEETVLETGFISIFDVLDNCKIQDEDA